MAALILFAKVLLAPDVDLRARLAKSTRPTIAGSGYAPRNFTLSDALRAPHLK